MQARQPVKTLQFEAPDGDDIDLVAVGGMGAPAMYLISLTEDGTLVIENSDGSESTLTPPVGFAIPGAFTSVADGSTASFIAVW